MMHNCNCTRDATNTLQVEIEFEALDNEAKTLCPRQDQNKTFALYVQATFYSIIHHTSASTLFYTSWPFTDQRVLKYVFKFLMEM